MTVILDELRTLPVSERLKLIGDLWDSICDDSARLPPLTKDQVKELDRRAAHFKKHPELGLTWQQVKRRARSRRAL